MSPSKNFAWANMRLMSLTRDTSQSPIGPFGPLEHSPFGDSLTHASTALLSCTRDRGENTTSRGGWSSMFEFQLTLNGTEVVWRSRFIWGRVRMRSKLKIFICARTTATNWRSIDKKYKEQDPEIGRWTNLHALVITRGACCEHLAVRAQIFVYRRRVSDLSITPCTVVFCA